MQRRGEKCAPVLYQLSTIVIPRY